MGNFRQFFKGGKFCNSFGFLAHQTNYEKGLFLKGNDLLPKGASSLLSEKTLLQKTAEEAKYIPLEKTSFTEGRQNYFDRVVSPESVPISPYLWSAVGNR